MRVKFMQVLIADDCPTTRNVLKKFLVKWGYDPVTAEDGEQALTQLTEDNAPRLAILDWNMPRVEGPVVCQRLRDSNLERYTYVIFLTAKEGEENLAEAMKSGADDYVTKPVSELELKYRLEAGRRVIELQDRILKSQRKIDVLSTHDLLTGVLNRASVFDRLKQELDRSRRKQSPVGIMTVQSNDLKATNEQLGRDAGDELLTEVGARLNQVIRTYDHVGRLEGGRFIIILPDTDREQTRKTTDRVLQALAANPLCVAGKPIVPSFNIGVCNSLDIGYDFEALLSGVDDATEQARESTDRIHYFVNPADSQSSRQASI